MKTGCRKLCSVLLIVTIFLSGLLVGCGDNNTDETAPLLILSAFDPTTTSRSRALAGTVEPGAVVEITVDTAAVVSDLVVAGGEWSCTIDALAPGDNLVNIIATDSTGNQRVLNLNLLYDALSIERWVTPVPVDAPVILGGLVAPHDGDRLTVTVGGVTSASVAVVSGDHWNVQLSGLAVGRNDVKVTFNHPDSGVGVVERTLVIDVNAAAPLLTIDQTDSPTVTRSQLVTGTRSDNLSLTILAATAEAGAIDLITPAAWSATLTNLQPGKNAFTVSAAANGVTVTARDLIVYNPFLTPVP